MKKILITGVAGFIGSWTAEALLIKGFTVIGVDNFNDYYDPRIKRDRIKKFSKDCAVLEEDICDLGALDKIFKDHKIDQVCHLAAQAGVGYSLINPFAYEHSNNLGTLNLLELCKKYAVPSFVFASSSSVYGGNEKIPFSESDNVDKPISLYAATKKYNELLAHTYHHLYGINTTALRFFSVYGPWGRPDMALYKFATAITKGQPINVFNFGKMKRDFTYITDIVTGILSALEKNYPCEIFNLGNSATVELNYFIEIIEKELGMIAKKKLMPMQPGDVPESFADIKKARKLLGFDPKTKIEEGVKEFIRWFREYHRL